MNNHEKHNIRIEFKFTAKIEFFMQEKFINNLMLSHKHDTESMANGPNESRINSYLYHFEKNLESRLNSKLSDNIIVKTTGYSIGSLSIFFSILATYDTISKYKDFSDSLTLVVEQSEDILHSLFNEFKPYDISFTMTNNSSTISNKANDAQSSYLPNNTYTKMIPNANRTQLILLIIIIIILLYGFQIIPSAKEGNADTNKMAEIQKIAEEAKRTAEENRLKILEITILAKIDANNKDNNAKLASFVNELASEIKDINKKLRRK